MIERDIRRAMTLDTDQNYQERVKVAANMICQPKQRDQINKGRDDMAIPAVEDVSHVSRYPMLDSMGFDTDISDGVAKIRSATLLEEFVLLHQRT